MDGGGFCSRAILGMNLPSFRVSLNGLWPYMCVQTWQTFAQGWSLHGKDDSGVDLTADDLSCCAADQILSNRSQQFLTDMMRDCNYSSLLFD